MKIELSNYIIKAYKKKSGFISFHFRSHFFIKTNVSFSVTAYLREISSYFILPGGHKVEFDSISIPVWTNIPYDGKILVSEIYMSSISNLNSVKSSLVDLTIRYRFSFTGHPSEEAEEYKCKALVKKTF